MADEWAPIRPPKAPRRWPRRLAWIATGGVVLLLILYLAATSSFFLEGFVLPRVSKAVNATITVGDATLHPFFSVTLRDLKIKTSIVEDPLLSAREVRARYSLFDIIRGNINVQEVTLLSPVVVLIEREDGTSNLDPLLQASKSEEATPTKSKPPQLSIKSVVLTNATVRHSKFEKDGSSSISELSGVNIHVANVRNQQIARIDLAASIKLDRTPPSGIASPPDQLLQFKLAGGFEAGLSAELKPQSLKGKLSLDVARVPDSFRTLSGVSALLECDASPTEVTQLSLSFMQKQNSLGTISINGPLDLAKKEGRLRLEISSIDKQVLNLAGAALGVDFGSTTLSTTNEIELADEGKIITATGNFNANKLSIAQKSGATKPMDVQLDYKLGFNQSDKSAVVSRFSLTVAQNQTPVVRGTLANPVTLALGGASNVVDQSAFDLVVTDLNLADWRPWLGDYTGEANLILHLLLQQSGQKLNLDLRSRLADFSAKFGSNKIENADLVLVVRGTVENFHAIHLDEYSLQLFSQKEPSLKLNGAGDHDLQTQRTDLQTAIEASLPRLLPIFAPDIKSSAGVIKLNAKIAQAGAGPTAATNSIPERTVTGTLRLESFSGQVSSSTLNSFETAFDFDLSLKNQLLGVRKLAGVFKQAGQNAGTCNITGQFDLGTQAAQGSIKFADLNERTFGPFVASALGDKKLSTVSVTFTGEGSYAPKGDADFKSELQLGNLLISDPKGQVPNAPIAAELKADLSLRNKTANIQRLTVQIRQDQQSVGSLEVTGQYDLQKQSGQAALKLTDLNEKPLQPFVASSPGERKLKSISVTASANAKYDSTGESSVAGTLQVTNLTMADAANRLPKAPLRFDLNWDASLRQGQSQLRQFVGKFAFGDKPAGTLTASGNYDLQKRSGRIAVTVADLNQNALAPVAAPFLGKKELSSVSISVNTSASYDPSGESSVTGSFGISDLVLSEGDIKGKPLAVALDIDGKLARNILNLEKLQLSLSPTDRAKNQLLLAGNLDFGKSNALTGNLQLSSDSLDLTPYYDLLSPTNPPPSISHGSNPAPSQPQSPPSRPATTSPTEPGPITLPLQQFIFGVNIGKFYLREIAIKNFHTSTRIDGGLVNVTPLQLVLNEGPVDGTVDLNLGVPGYRYDVKVTANKVPLEPIANTFSPNQRGAYKGDLFLNTQIKGAGVTGGSLSKNLSGQLGLNLTNANIQVASPSLKAFLSPIALLLGTPELMNSPLNGLSATTEMGTGKINIAQLNVLSETFTADTQGQIRIADVLMESPLEHWPMHFSLKRSLAQRLKFVSRSTSDDSPYIKLPDFVKVAGTLGSPKAELDKLALTRSAFESLTKKVLGGKENPAPANPLNLLNPLK